MGVNCAPGQRQSRRDVGVGEVVGDEEQDRIHSYGADRIVDYTATPVPQDQ